MKSFAADPVVGYELQEGHLTAAPSARRSITTFTLDSIKQRNSYLELHGKLKLYVRLEGTQTLSATQIISPTVLVISTSDFLNAQDLTDALPNLLFYHSIADAVAAIPVWQAPCLPQVFSPTTGKLAQPAVCTPARTDSTADSPKTTAPKLTKQVDPELPKSIRNVPAGKWEVQVSCTIDEKGIPQSVRVLKPSYLLSNGRMSAYLTEDAANDLDSSAVSAIKRYRFIPAMKDGKPTAFHLFIAVAYETFAN